MGDLIQVCLLMSSGLAIHLLAKGSLRAGCVVGLIGQPFWLFTTWQAGQWGMLLLSLWFSFSYGKGLLKG